MAGTPLFALVVQAVARSLGSLRRWFVRNVRKALGCHSDPPEGGYLSDGHLEQAFDR